MSLKAKLEAIIYAAETPITLDQMVELVGESVIAEGATEDEVASHVRVALEELIDDYAAADRGIEVRQIAGGYRMSTKPEQHDVVRAFAKSLKPPIRLSMPALETLAVIAYKQPVTVPEINEIRGVDCSGVIATLSGSQAGHHRRAQSGHRTANPLQDNQRVSLALWLERCRRAAQHGRIREVGRGVISERLAAAPGNNRAEALPSASDRKSRAWLPASDGETTPAGSQPARMILRLESADDFV